jgi:hypothetical protein
VATAVRWPRAVRGDRHAVAKRHRIAEADDAQATLVADLTIHAQVRAVRIYRCEIPPHAAEVRFQPPGQQWVEFEHPRGGRALRVAAELRGCDEDGERIQFASEKTHAQFGEQQQGRDDRDRDRCEDELGAKPGLWHPRLIASHPPDGEHEVHRLRR